MNVMGTLSALSILLLVVTSTIGERSTCVLTFNSSNTTPDTSNILENPQVIYYQLNDTNDTVKYVWSLVGLPTLFMSVTGGETSDCITSANASFEWDEFFSDQSSGSAHIPGFDKDLAFSIVFRSAIEFRDKDAKAQKKFNAHQLNNNETYNIVPLNDLEWSYHHSKGLLKGKSTGNDSKLELDVNIKVPTSSGRLGYFPKTSYTPDSTTFDFVFSNFQYSFSDEANDNSHLVLEVLLVHGPTKNGSVSKHFSIDDEYTPSVFQTYNYIFGESGDVENKKGFLQWKPISYLSEKRLSTKSQQANAIAGLPFGYVNLTDHGSLAGALYNSSTVGNITQMFIVLATEGDEEDGNSKYVSWTGILGFGEPPEDNISSVVWITIFVGLGLPAVITVLGGIYLIIRKKPWKKVMKLVRSNRDGYQALDEHND